MLDDEPKDLDQEVARLEDLVTQARRDLREGREELIRRKLGTGHVEIVKDPVEVLGVLSADHELPSVAPVK